MCKILKCTFYLFFNEKRCFLKATLFTSHLTWHFTKPSSSAKYYDFLNTFFPFSLYTPTPSFFAQLFHTKRNWGEKKDN